MNTLELKSKAKEEIDVLFSDFDELKVRAEQIDYQLRKTWEKEMKNLENDKESLRDIYNKIVSANEASASELLKKFDEQKTTVEKRIEHLRELYSKTLN